ncbi:MAG: monovalent cation/H(+) antiporter subunit G [Clostridiales Family XIII bacterium]|jgi:multicomponent Na+:H+ antiporter subunit G|nr:monovalent cation/H(+) antiporter subunit G [Clostridiales Family XIII bacterium]
MNLGIQILISFFLLAGSIFFLGGSVGLIRFPDAYSRMHALGKPITLGMICYLVAAFIFFLATEHGFDAITVIVLIFIFLTSPVGTHMIAKTSYHRATPLSPKTIRDELGPVMNEMVQSPEEMEALEKEGY